MAEAENKGNIRLIITDDGSHSLFVPALNETYHSFHGALQESRHVFIKMGLEYALNQKASPHVLEVGLGTGLNALLAAECAETYKISVHFTSIEAFPVDYSLAASLNYPKFIAHPDAEQWFEDIHRSDWHVDRPIHSLFTLKKLHTKLEDCQLPSSQFDVVFFDAFAPSKQAELWGMEILTRIVESMASQSVFVTYCAKGQLKRDLKALGLQVETLPGPPGKKEMVRALKF
ncbi:hypothetical protein C900_01766 [Fulvivirga imtechensis AK7]|uniref:MnmC-like methyltransferase domain-containing protein n=1 Tax=Fulvivirga imtechensis AK7 TaxID=1237149 RepID=L8JYD2_9BACT|nr:tRNA (5-methylaminomethyl-2-thiouridine)(34)-methyltransferase MnmD [Fulvivirga imtechensis]ELR72212.1 hypothetical protein C900_01766 [Fulvivirga imtechensis AK7]